MGSAVQARAVEGPSKVLSHIESGAAVEKDEIASFGIPEERIPRCRVNHALEAALNRGKVFDATDVFDGECGRIPKIEVKVES